MGSTPGRAWCPMAERLLTYDEMTVLLRRSPEGVRQLAKRKRWRRVLGNDGRARIAVPVDFIEASALVDAPPTAPADMATTPASTPPPTPAPDRPVEPEPTAPTGDARALVELLHSRIEELSVDLRQARAEITELAATAGRVSVLEALMVERD